MPVEKNAFSASVVDCPPTGLKFGESEILKDEDPERNLGAPGAFGFGI